MGKNRKISMEIKEPNMERINYIVKTFFFTNFLIKDLLYLISNFNFFKA
jgi:hypothetical protein